VVGVTPARTADAPAGPGPPLLGAEVEEPTGLAATPASSADRMETPAERDAARGADPAIRALAAPIEPLRQLAADAAPAVSVDPGRRVAADAAPAASIDPGRQWAADAPSGAFIDPSRQLAAGARPVASIDLGRRSGIDAPRGASIDPGRQSTADSAAEALLDQPRVPAADTVEGRATWTPPSIPTEQIMAVQAFQPALPPAPPHAVPSIPTEPPLALGAVTRVFEPYGSLLSREGAVRVDWTPSSETAVVCVAPGDVSRSRMVQLASRLARVLAGTDDPSTRVRRLALRTPDGVAVLTPLSDGILVAAASRPGAAALLEVLSARVVPGPFSFDVRASGSSDSPETREVGVAEGVRVETSAATVDVLGPAEIAGRRLGELAGRVLAAIAERNDGTLEALSIDLGTHRLVVHPVLPDARPPRYVAVLGSSRAPGLLGRRSEQAARALRAAS
jgi:hypothetical protein